MDCDFSSRCQAGKAGTFMKFFSYCRFTDLYAGYQEPVLLPAVPVDQGMHGVPSDHAGVQALPRTNLSTTRARLKKKTFLVQRMPESMVSSFGPVLVEESWSCLVDGMSAEEMVDTFQDAATRLVDTHFPKKSITVTEGDKPFFTDELKRLRRKCDNIYQKSGKCQKYLEVQHIFQTKLKAEALKYKKQDYTRSTGRKEGVGVQCYQVPRGGTS